ncbi:MAG: DMT family transporter [Gammaproteobacteria bacterium]
MQLIPPRARIFLGATLISFSPVWVKLVDVAPTASAFYRMLIGGIALSAFIVVTRRSFRFSRIALVALVAAAVFFALDLWFWHRSVLYVGPGLSTLLANFQVFAMTAVGIVFLGQRASVWQLVAIPVAIAGLALVVGVDWSVLSPEYRIGVLFGLATAASYTGYLLSLRRAQAESGHVLPRAEIAVMSLVCAGVLALLVMAEGGSFVVPTGRDAFWLICYGVLSHVLGWLLIAGSLSQVSTAIVGISLLLQPLLSYVWEILLFDRVVSPTEMAGAAIALAAIFMGSRPPRESP